MSTSRHRLGLRWLPGGYAVCRLDAADEVPSWAGGPGFTSVTRSHDELSIVTDERRVPPSVQAERGWSAFRVTGTLDFALTGVLSSLTAPLAEAGIGVFVISTFDTDLLLVRQADRDAAQRVLSAIADWSP